MTEHMTPEQARTILDGWMVAGPEWCPDDMREHNERTAYETIAALRPQYGVRWWPLNTRTPSGPHAWHDDERQAQLAVKSIREDGCRADIITRYVLDPEGETND